MYFCKVSHCISHESVSGISRGQYKSAVTTIFSNVLILNSSFLAHRNHVSKHSAILTIKMKIKTNTTAKYTNFCPNFRQLMFPLLFLFVPSSAIFSQLSLFSQFFLLPLISQFHYLHYDRFEEIYLKSAYNIRKQKLVSLKRY